MTLPLVRAVAQVERSDDWHLARLMVLLNAASGTKKNKPVEGIMKLAKLDFLLRYPNCLERLLQITEGDIEAAHIQPFERGNVEAKMVRFRYGPWDDRYRRWIGLLVARDLAQTYTKGKTVNVSLTQRGQDVAVQIAALDEYEDIAVRSQLIIDAVGSMKATKLKGFIYQIFPELIDMKWGEEIAL